MAASFCALFVLWGCGESAEPGKADAATGIDGTDATAREDGGSDAAVGEDGGSDAAVAEDGGSDGGVWEPLCGNIIHYSDGDGRGNGWLPEPGKAKGTTISFGMPRPDPSGHNREIYYGSGLDDSMYRLDGPARYQAGGDGMGIPGMGCLWAIPPGTYTVQIFIANEEVYSAPFTFADNAFSVLNLYNHKNYGAGASLTPLDDPSPPSDDDWRFYFVNASQDHHGQSLDVYAYPSDTDDTNVAERVPTNLLKRELLWGEAVGRDVSIGTEYFAEVLHPVDPPQVYVPYAFEEEYFLNKKFIGIFNISCDSTGPHLEEDGPCRGVSGMNRLFLYFGTYVGPK
jgi:hypothetical protein